ncbi:type IV toxin-antitoxin system AbiEi family antitoxin domain-containing protein [Candidatus Bathyarchaeota archaeon]|nr:type IV toxin-antitoxin system AbiEi family antitoxin domain-containing protein [Candidatus Bathyarchaeota archaeon]
MISRESINKYRKALSEKEARILSDLSYKGKGIFSINDIKKYVENPKDILYRLVKKNWILRLKKGVYLIAPLDAGELGANRFTVHSFVIGSYLVDPYYISHWSALNYYGFTEQTPPSTYIATTKPRNKKRILDNNFVFVTINKKKMFGVTSINVDKYNVKISTPEKTIVDCLDHPEHCGGIEEVAKAIYFEHDELDFMKITNMAAEMGNKTIIKRLGYLLDLFEFAEYSSMLENIPLSKGYSKLEPKGLEKGKINEKWRLNVNVKIDSRQWMI